MTESLWPHTKKIQLMPTWHKQDTNIVPVADEAEKVY